MSSSQNIDVLIKPKKEMNNLELSALCAIKSSVFVEYPPKGNDISLDFATEAKTLNPEESEWLGTWLRAKGRVRRYYRPFEKPDDEELYVANILRCEKSSRYLIQSSTTFLEAAKYQKKIKNWEECKILFTTSSELLLKAIDLVGEDPSELQSLLLACTDLPKEYHFQDKINEIIIKLNKFDGIAEINSALGKYYFKHEKDYDKAKLHLSRAVSAGIFGCAMLLLKLECIIQPVQTFDFVKTLNMMCESFTSPNRRLSLISQILLYEYYHGKDPKVLIHYLRMYMNQDIDDSFKKRQLIHCYPMFDINILHLRPNEFLNNLVSKIKTLQNYKFLTVEERTDNDETFRMFEKMLKSKIDESFVTNSKVDQSQKDVPSCCRNNDNSILKKPDVSNKRRIGSGRLIGFSNNKNFENFNENQCEEKNKSLNWRSKMEKPYNSDSSYNNQFPKSVDYSSSPENKANWRHKTKD